jgi:3-methyladenine DNA glycosylase AlkD
MNKIKVLAILRSHKNEVGIQNWKKLDRKTHKLTSFGIGLTVLRKLAKEIGKDHALAKDLWTSEVYDARVISLLIDDPKQITREQAEAQVKQLKHGSLAHVFSSCDAPLAKAPFAKDLASEWMASKDAMRRRCGFALLYEESKNKKKSAPDDAFFLERIEHISRSIRDEEYWVRGAMGGALLGIGKRNAKLNKAALKVARAIGPIPVSSGDNSCEPFDVVKHLTSDYITKKLGV